MYDARTFAISDSSPGGGSVHSSAAFAISFESIGLIAMPVRFMTMSVGSFT
jgi:hypothetical protein